MTILPKKKSQNKSERYANSRNLTPNEHHYSHHGAHQSHRYNSASIVVASDIDVTSGAMSSGSSTAMLTKRGKHSVMAGESTGSCASPSVSGGASPNNIYGKFEKGYGNKQRGNGNNQVSLSAKSLTKTGCSSSSSSKNSKACNSDDEYGEGFRDDQLEIRFAERLRNARGFIIKTVKGDGACMFRAVADQVYGDEEMHDQVRTLCMDYIAQNRDHFSQFLTEDFDEYLARKRRVDSHGNHVELQAISEIYSRPIEIYEYSIDPINTFYPISPEANAGAVNMNAPLRLSYHGMVHYNSVVDPLTATIGVGLGLPDFTPGLADKNLMKEAQLASECQHIEEAMLSDKLRMTDWERTEDELSKQVAAESYMDYVRQMERNALRARVSPPPRDFNRAAGGKATFSREVSKKTIVNEQKIATTTTNQMDATLVKHSTDKNKDKDGEKTMEKKSPPIIVSQKCGDSAAVDEKPTFPIAGTKRGNSASSPDVSHHVNRLSRSPECANGMSARRGSVSPQAKIYRDERSASSLPNIGETGFSAAFFPSLQPTEASPIMKPSTSAAILLKDLPARGQERIYNFELNGDENCEKNANNKEKVQGAILIPNIEPQPSSSSKLDAITTTIETTGAENTASTGLYEELLAASCLATDSGEWTQFDESVEVARVLALSQQEFFETMKKRRE